MWFPRTFRNYLETVARERPAVVVTGARQTGKTSLLERTFPDHHYVSLDVPATADQAETSGEEFLRRHPPPLVIDEVQYAPAVFRYLKAAIDEKRDQVGQYILTGSERFGLMEKVSESLAGRAAILQLEPLALEELERGFEAVAEGDRFYEWLFRGGYPELHAKELSTDRFYGDYVATYLERDVRRALNVRSLRDFDRFMRLCALRTGNLFSMNSIASDVGISPNTVRGWLSVLEASGLITLLQPYYENFGKRIVKSPKLYFSDTGLAAYLIGFRNAAELRKSQHFGALFETQVLNQITRWHTNRGKRAAVYFYRDHHGTEVDFVIPRGGSLQLIECKASETVQTAPPSFAALQKRVPASMELQCAVISPTRGHRRIRGTNVDVYDCVDLDELLS